MLKKIFKKISIIKKKILNKKESYSFGGVDLIIDYIFKNQKEGFYIDVGCQHPIANNNTYLLYKKKGWHGLNIDLDQKNIDLFNLSRKKDLNICAALSIKKETKDLFFYHNGSAINTLVKDVALNRATKYSEIRKIETSTLNSIIEENRISNKINYLNIDTEGNELEVLKGFNLKKYKPNVISIEFLDLKMKKLEMKNNLLKNVLDSELYKHMVDNDYNFINWNHADLIFTHKEFRD